MRAVQHARATRPRNAPRARPARALRPPASTPISFTLSSPMNA